MPKPRVVNVQFNNESVFWGEYRHHLLAEGDSWFSWGHMNLKPSSNLLEELNFREKAVVISYAYAGDTMRSMGNISSNAAFATEVRSQSYEAILLSGGGNDLIDALPYILKAQAAGSPPAAAADCFDAAALDTLFDAYVLPNYRQIINHRGTGAAINRATPVVIHTYDIPTPRDAPATFMGLPAKGPWLLPALRNANIPADLHQAVTEALFRGMGAKLRTLHDPGNHVHVVDTAGTIAPAMPDATELSGDWINEIHPDAYGYSLLSARLNEKLAELGID